MWKAIYLNKNIPYFPAYKMHFFPLKIWLNSTCILCAEGKYYFQTYKYLYIYYTKSLSWYDFSGSDNDFLGFCDE
jgi:protein associated with RNAse G/E